MKKIIWIVIASVLILCVGVIVFVRHDIESHKNKNSVETLGTMEYTDIDNMFEIKTEHVGYAIVEDGKITGFIDSEGNTDCSE